MKTYKIIRLIIIIELSCIFFLISMGANHASDYQRELFRLTHDSQYLTNESIIMYQYQIQLLVFMIIINMIFSIFDMFFKYTKNRIKHSLLLVAIIIITVIVVDILRANINNEDFRYKSSFSMYIYLLFISIIMFFGISLIHKNENTNHQRNTMIE